MKRLTVLLVVLMLFSVALTACVGTVDQNEASKWCKAHNDCGLKHGKCVSYFTSASDIAKFCQENWQTGGFENQGQCVSAINAEDVSLLPAACSAQ